MWPWPSLAPEGLPRGLAQREVSKRRVKPNPPPHTHTSQGDPGKYTPRDTYTHTEKHNETHTHS